MKKLTTILLTSFLSFICVFGAVNAYTVVSGDTMWKIAQNAGMSLTELINLNPQIANPDLIYPGQEINTEALLGATNNIAGATYTLAGSGVNKTATSITLNSLTYPQTGALVLDAHLSDTFFITLEPGNTKKQELVSCTTVTQNAGGTATLSGCSRGLLPFTPYTASSTYSFTHAGGSQVVFSDPPQLFNLYAALANNETITGNWTFNVSDIAFGGTISGVYNIKGVIDYLRYNTSTSMVQWSNNGSDFYDFTSTTITQLTASSTSGIGVLDSKIYIKASSTLGMTFDSAGSLYQKVSSSMGILTDSNGLYTDYSRNNTWTGTNTFTTTTFSVLPTASTSTKPTTTTLSTHYWSDGIIAYSGYQYTKPLAEATGTMSLLIPLSQWSMGTNDEIEIDCYANHVNGNFGFFLTDGVITTTLSTKFPSGQKDTMLNSKIYNKGNTGVQSISSLAISSSSTSPFWNTKYTTTTLDSTRNWTIYGLGYSESGQSWPFYMDFCSVSLKRLK